MPILETRMMTVNEIGLLLVKHIRGEHNVYFRFLVRVLGTVRGYRGTGPGVYDGTTGSVCTLTPRYIVAETPALSRATERDLN